MLNSWLSFVLISIRTIDASAIGDSSKLVELCAFGWRGTQTRQCWRAVSSGVVDSYLTLFFMGNFCLSLWARFYPCIKKGLVPHPCLALCFIYQRKIQSISLILMSLYIKRILEFECYWVLSIHRFINRLHSNYYWIFF